MRGVYWTLPLVLMAALTAPNAIAQEPGTREQASVSTGERTLVGCVAQGANGFVLVTQDGRTVPLRGATDLAPYQGKKVQIHTSWTSKGIHVAGPGEGAEAVPATTGAGSAPTSQEFAGSLQAQFQGKVLGDCLGKKKK